MPTPLTTAQQVASAETATVSPVADLLAATQQLVNFTVPAEDLPTAGTGASTLGRIGTLYAPFLAWASGLETAIHALSLMLQALLPSTSMTLTSITPSSVAQGASAVSLDIVGTGVTSDTTLVFSDAKITVVDVTPAGDGDSLTGHINVAADATVGAGTVHLHSPTTGDSGTVAFSVTSSAGPVLVLTQNGTPVSSPIGMTVGDTLQFDGAHWSDAPGTDVLANLDFETSAPAVFAADRPTITGIDYTTLPQGQSKLVTITGTNARTAGQSLGGVTSAGLSQSGFTRISDTEWQVTLTASGGADVATDNLYIIDATHGNSNTVAESVTAAASPLDVVNITPQAHDFSGGSGAISTDPIAVTAGKRLVFAYRYYDLGHAPVFEDTAGNAYVEIGAAVGTGGGPTIRLFECKNCLGNAANVLTISDLNIKKAAVLFQLDGTSETLDHDATAVGAYNSTGSVTTGAFTTAAAKEILVLAFTHDFNSNTPIWSIPSDWTQRTTEPSDHVDALLIATKIVAGVQTGATVTVSCGNGDNPFGRVVTFQ